jgi:hypothetical protein
MVFLRQPNLVKSAPTLVKQSPTMQSRAEFRTVLREVIQCLRSQLDVPGVSPFQPEQLSDWFHEITPEDIEAVWDQVSSPLQLKH